MTPHKTAGERPVLGSLAVGLSAILMLGCGPQRPPVPANSRPEQPPEPEHIVLRVNNVLPGTFDTPFTWVSCGDELVVIPSGEPRDSYHTSDLVHWSRSPLPATLVVTTSACLEGAVWAAGRNGLILRYDSESGWVTVFEHPTHHEQRDRSTSFTRIVPGSDRHPQSVMGIDANGQPIEALYDASTATWSVRDAPRQTYQLPGYYEEGHSPCDRREHWRPAADDFSHYQSSLVCTDHLILLSEGAEEPIYAIPLPSMLDASYSWSSHLLPSAALVWRSLYRTDPSTVDLEEDVLWNEEEEQLNRSEIALYDGERWLISEVEGRVFWVDTWRDSVFVAMTTGLHEVVSTSVPDGVSVARSGIPPG